MEHRYTLSLSIWSGLKVTSLMYYSTSKFGTENAKTSQIKLHIVAHLI